MNFNQKIYLCLLTILGVTCQPTQAFGWPSFFNKSAFSGLAVIATTIGSYNIWQRYNAPVAKPQGDTVEKRHAAKKAIIAQANSKPFFKLDWFENIRKRQQETADLQAQAAAIKKAAIDTQIFNDRELAKALAREIDLELDRAEKKAYAEAQTAKFRAANPQRPTPTKPHRPWVD